jgi:hypothetical protein
MAVIVLNPSETYSQPTGQEGESVGLKNCKQGAYIRHHNVVSML